MKAIETRYRGYRFRSRLEARWAVFLDSLFIEWEYELQGFQLKDGTRYLPDFYLPTFSGGMYVEVKHSEAGYDKPGGWEKAHKFSEESDKPVWFAAGAPAVKAYAVWYRGDYYLGIPNADQAKGENRMFASPGYENYDGSINPHDFDLVGSHVISAVTASRSARFEHGEKPTW